MIPVSPSASSSDGNSHTTVASGSKEGTAQGSGPHEEVVHDPNKFQFDITLDEDSKEDEEAQEMLSCSSDSRTLLQQQVQPPQQGAASTQVTSTGSRGHPVIQLRRHTEEDIAEEVEPSPGDTEAWPLGCALCWICPALFYKRNRSASYNRIPRQNNNQQDLWCEGTLSTNSTKLW